MPRPLVLASCLSLAAVALAGEAGTYPHQCYTTTVNETLTLAAPTVFVSVTQYVPVTTVESTTETSISTTTQPITIFQTIVSTQIIVRTEYVTETYTTVTTTPTTVTATTTVPTTLTETTVTTLPTTLTETSVTILPTTLTETSVTILPTTLTETTATTLPTTLTETTVTTSPATLTATEQEVLFTSTSRVTSVTVCPTRLVNAAYTAALPYPTEWTWGCPPGWLCRPPKVSCNFEFGLPDRNFICSPDHCIPASALPSPLATWDADIYGNSTPIDTPGLTIQALDSYFNMAPGDFGLSYEIFVVDEVLTLTSTRTLAPNPTGVGARQAQTSVPGACYPWCNNCLLEAQANGKTPALCVPGSAFAVSLEQCESCIAYHRTDDVDTFVQIAPQFQQFLDYCDQYSTVTISTYVTSTTTNSAGAILTSSSSTLATTVTPRTSAPPASSGPQTEVTTVTASTATETPPVTTTSTSVTTYASTWTGDEWSSITVIMPVGANSTTTLSGSDLTNATLIVPYTSASTATSVVTPSTTESPPAQFTGMAVRVGDSKAAAFWLVPLGMAFWGLL